MASKDRALNEEGRAGRGDEGYAVLAGQTDGESGDPDLELDVPSLRVEEIELEVEDLQVHLSIQAELADLVKINIGLDVELGEAKLGIKGVEAQAQLKASLDNVRAVFSEVLQSLEHNPRFFRDSPGPADRTTGPSQEATRDALDAGETAEGAATDEADAPEVEATNAAREKARELGLDLSTLEGTGSNGRIVLRDVMEAARS